MRTHSSFRFGIAGRGMAMVAIQLH